MIKTPEKGKPSFINLPDSRVREYRDTVTDLMGNFSECPEICKALKAAWEALNAECIERTSSMPEVTKTPLLKRKRVVRLSALKTSQPQ